jgi:hypothetical protein
MAKIVAVLVLVIAADRVWAATKGGGISILGLVAERMVSAFDVKSSHTISARMENNADMVTAVGRSPLVGYGFGANIRADDGVRFFVSDTSNYYLRLLLFFGLPGFFVCVWWAISYLRFVHGSMRRLEDPMARALLSSSILAITAIGLIMLAFPSFVHYPVGAYGALAVAFAGVAWRVVPRPRVSA